METVLEADCSLLEAGCSLTPHIVEHLVDHIDLILDAHINSLLNASWLGLGFEDRDGLRQAQTYTETTPALNFLKKMKMTTNFKFWHWNESKINQ